jgi:hypothetical protein
LAHVCYNAFAGGTTSQSLVCLTCQSNLGLFRRLTNDRFCRDEHEAMYLAELQQLALTRLHNAVATTSVDSAETPLHCEAKVNRENHELTTAVVPAPCEPTQALMVLPKLTKFRPSPAYRLAE